jgi:hypothetical protein
MNYDIPSDWTECTMFSDSYRVFLDRHGHEYRVPYPQEPSIVCGTGITLGDIPSHSHTVYGERMTITRKPLPFINKCKYCGRRVSQEQEFCNGCGASVG